MNPLQTLTDALKLIKQICFSEPTDEHGVKDWQKVNRICDEALSSLPEKQLSEAEIKELAEKEFPFRLVDGNLTPMTEHNKEQQKFQQAYIKGFRAAIQQGNAGKGMRSFLPVLEENYEAAKKMKKGTEEYYSPKGLLVETYQNLISIYKANFESGISLQDEWISPEELQYWKDRSSLCDKLIRTFPGSVNFQTRKEEYENDELMTKWRNYPPPPNAQKP